MLRTGKIYQNPAVPADGGVCHRSLRKPAGQESIKNLHEMRPYGSYSVKNYRLENQCNRFELGTIKNAIDSFRTSMSIIIKNPGKSPEDLQSVDKITGPV